MTPELIEGLQAVAAGGELGSGDFAVKLLSGETLTAFANPFDGSLHCSVSRPIDHMAADGVRGLAEDLVRACADTRLGTVPMIGSLEAGGEAAALTIALPASLRSNAAALGAALDSACLHLAGLFDRWGSTHARELEETLAREATWLRV